MGISMELVSCSFLAELDTCEGRKIVLKAVLPEGVYYLLILNDVITEDNVGSVKALAHVPYRAIHESLFSLLKEIICMTGDEVIYYCGTTNKKVVKRDNLIYCATGITHDEDTIEINLGSVVEIDTYEIDVSKYQKILQDCEGCYYLGKMKPGITLL